MDGALLLRSTLILFAVTNPIGSILLFLQLTEKMPRDDRRHAFRVAILTSAARIAPLSAMRGTLRRDLMRTKLRGLPGSVNGESVVSIRLAGVLVVACAVALCAAGFARAAEQAETERLLKGMAPRIVPVETAAPKPELFADFSYEPGSVLQGTRTGSWNEMTALFGCTYGTVRGYASLSRFERIDLRDQTANAGAYLNMKDAYAHLELGYGWEGNFIYRYQAIAEYAHRVVKDLYAQAGYSYRSYKAGDTHLVYPGLAYYFGDSYLGADYGVSYIEGRDTAHFGSVKGAFAITDFLQWTLGAAFGERLYDIFGIDADQETGFILSTGVRVKLGKTLSARVGYSYGEEEPKFIKRSVSFGISATF